jgi:hypothetical protein
MIDYPYIVLFVIMLALSLKKDRNRKMFQLSAILTFIFIAFRAPVVGADTYNYVRYFTGEQAFYSLEDTREFEIGFIYYNEILKSIARNGIFYMFINYIVILSPVYYLIKKYSSKPAFSIFLFFALFIHQPYFVALRQLLSISFILWGVIYVVEKRKHAWIFFMLFSILAYLFHSTAVFVVSVLLVSYFVKLSNKRNIYLLIVASTFIGPLLGSISYLKIFSMLMSFDLSLTSRINGYLESDQIFTGLSLISLIIKPLIGLFVIRYIYFGLLNHWFIKIFVVSIVISNLFYSFPFLSRINLGLWIFSIIVITWVLSSRQYKIHNKAIMTYMIIFMSYFSFVYIRECINPDLKDAGRMHPYYFFFQDYSDHPSIKYFN